MIDSCPHTYNYEQHFLLCKFQQNSHYDQLWKKFDLMHDGVQ